MTPFYWIKEETPDVAQEANTLGLSTSMWFPPGYMWDPGNCWMYNHVKPDPADPYLRYDADHAIQELKPIQLRRAADARIRLAGFEGPPQDWPGLLCANYEDYISFTHPGENRHLSQLDSYHNHVLLVKYLRAFYPNAQLANWGLPLWQHHSWGNADDNGFMLLGKLTAMYDYGCPSAYCAGRADDLDWVQGGLNYAAQWDMPLVVYVNAWERWKLDNKWHTPSPGKLEAVLEIATSTPNVIGVEMWSMVQNHYIKKGWMMPGITDTSQIEDQHVEALNMLSAFVL